MPNALFIIPNLTTGGIQTQVVLLAKYFKKELGFNVTIWGVVSQDSYFPAMLAKEGIKTEMHPEVLEFFREPYWELSRFNKIRKWNRLRKAINKENIDIILPYTHHISFVFDIIWARTKAKICFKFERGGHLAPKPIEYSRRDIYHFLARHPKPTYVANSEHGQRALSIMQNVPIEKVHLIRNAYNPKPILNITEDWQEIIKSHQSKTVVTMIANFFDEKDHETVLNAWSLIHRNKAILILAGLGGPENCKANHKRMMQLSKELALSDEVYFAGSVKNTALLLKYTNIGLLSTKSEGCPNAILEYMGAGLPIIATDIPGIREVIPNESKNYLFPYQNVEKLRSLLVEVISNVGLQKELGTINQNHVNAYFSPEIMYSKYHDILKSSKII